MQFLLKKKEGGQNPFWVTLFENIYDAGDTLFVVPALTSTVTASATTVSATLTG